jgi:hypothetical protein
MKQVMALLLCVAIALAALAPGNTATAQSAQRISFAPGSISATVNGSVSPGRPVQYVLRALAGQTMTIQTNSTGPFRLSVTGANGAALGYADANQPLQVVLPSTQDYYIYLQSPTDVGTAWYTMQVTVVSQGPRPTATPVPRPQTQRITFAPGAVSATVYGYVDSARPANYVLKALAGQDMTVQFYGGGPYQATLSGADGSHLGSASAGGVISARLPRTQDYNIAVRAPADAPGSNFTLVVTVVGASPRPTPPAPSTQRITFARGAVSATVNGVTPQNYVLKALRGQTMYVELFTTYGAPASVRIETAGGQTLGWGSESSGWSGVLPGTQDYYFRVESPAGGGSTNFSLRVTIY